MKIVTLIISLLNYLGMNPNQTIREFILYPIWKTAIYLNANIIHIVGIVVIAVLFWVVRKKGNKTKRYSQYIKIIILSGIIYSFCLFIAIFNYNPLDKVLLADKTKMRLIILPVFELDSESYLKQSDNSNYFQDTLCEYLNRYKPELPEGIEVAVINLPAEDIPTFLYKPNTFVRYFDKIEKYELLFWGYRLDSNIEKLKLDMDPKQAIWPDREMLYSENNSDILSTLFNELKTIPLKIKIEFLSLLIVGTIEQSFNTVLMDLKQYDLALHQINKSLTRIDVAFKNILEMLPRDRRGHANFLYIKYKRDFEKYKINIIRNTPHKLK